MNKLKDVRIFARLPDGTVRQAVRFGDSPTWSWVLNNESEVERQGDVILSFANVGLLPKDALGFLL